MVGTEERSKAVDPVPSSSSTTVSVLPSAEAQQPANLQNDDFSKSESSISSPLGTAPTTSPAVSVTSPSIPRQTAPTAAPSATNIQNPIGSSGPRKNGVPAGAVAGVAIGCLIAGAAIGALILFFLRRRKSRNGAAVRQRPLEYGNGHLRLEKNPVVTTTLVTSSVDNYLPQPLEDAAITREISMISDHLKNHVRAYYHTHPAKAEDINEADLGAFSSATELETSEAKRLFLDQSTRSETIRLFLAWTILSRCDGTRPQNLLPSGVSAIMQSGLPAKESNSGTLHLPQGSIRQLTTMQPKPHSSVNGRSSQGRY